MSFPREGHQIAWAMLEWGFCDSGIVLLFYSSMSFRGFYSNTGIRPPQLFILSKTTIKTFKTGTTTTTMTKSKTSIKFYHLALLHCSRPTRTKTRRRRLVGLLPRSRRSPSWRTTWSSSPRSTSRSGSSFSWRWRKTNPCVKCMGSIE